VPYLTKPFPPFTSLLIAPVDATQYSTSPSVPATPFGELIPSPSDLTALFSDVDASLAKTKLGLQLNLVLLPYKFYTTGTPPPPQKTAKTKTNTPPFSLTNAPPYYTSTHNHPNLAESAYNNPPPPTKSKKGGKAGAKSQ
jgi:hypothetical protein